MATITSKNYGLSGKTLGIDKYEGAEANSQSFLVNGLVYASSGTITACTAAGTTILGLATKAATNVTTGNVTIPVVVLNTETRVWLQPSNGTTVGAGSASYLGVRYGISLYAGAYFFHTSDTSNIAVKVWAKHPDDAHSDTGCRYECSFIDTVLQR